MGPMDFGNLLAKVESAVEAFTAHASDMKDRVGSVEGALDSALKRIAQIETQVAPILTMVDPAAAPIAAVVEGATRALDSLIEVVGSGAQSAIAAVDASTTQGEHP